MRTSQMVGAAAALLISSAFVVPAAAQQGAPESPQEKAPAVRVLVKTFQIDSIERVVRLRGVTDAARSLQVSAQTAGLVISEPLRKGARVNAGDVLCELEPGERLAELAQAEASRAKAQADADASTRLAKGGFSSDVQVAADQAALAAAEAAVARIKLDISRLKMTAPFDGVLESDAAEIGALLQPGSACAELIAIDPIRFVGYATEVQVGSLALGGPAKARLIDGREIDAKVTFISRGADAATRTFQVEATAPNPEDRDGGQLRSGMSAEITLPVADDKGHLLPSSALTLDADGRIGVRVAVKEGAAHVARFKPVSLIADTPDGVWVLGLADEETVIVRGQEYVADGSPIEPVNEADAAPSADG